jgi:DNA-binding transcriptional MerR regulator
MSVEINGKVYYRTKEVYTQASISRATLFRWLKEGIIAASYRDRRGWKMFNEADLDRIKAEATRFERRWTIGGGPIIA